MQVNGPQSRDVTLWLHTSTPDRVSVGNFLPFLKGKGMGDGDGGRGGTWAGSKVPKTSEHT